MARSIVSPRRLRGSITVPGDKSISHRALIFNAVGQGRARISNFLAAADCLSTIACLRALGVEVCCQEEAASSVPEVTVLGLGAGGLREPEDVLDAGNSGTTLRLLTGLLAAQPFLSVLTGDASLRSRPMGRVIQPLRLMGADIRGRHQDTLAPLAIQGGQLRGIDYALPVASAQLKSALILAGLFAQGPTTLQEPASSRDHTERMLRAMGAHIGVQDGLIGVEPLGEPLRCQDIRVPGDLSSAAFWLVAAALHPDAELTIRGVGVNPTRTGVLEVLEAMGARLRRERVREEGGEPVADLVIQSSELGGCDIGGWLIPRLIDEIPVLAVAAALARGTTQIRDAAELRVKESDRIATVARELTKFGARIEEEPDGMTIHGVPRLFGAACESHGDHRLAMALAVAGLVAQGETALHGEEAVQVSYPGFWDDLATLAGGTQG